MCSSDLGVSPYDLPPYNASPGRGGFGIRPRYWTSLSSSRGELESLMEKALTDLAVTGVEDLIEKMTSRSERNTTVTIQTS